MKMHGPGNVKLSLICGESGRKTFLAPNRDTNSEPLDVFSFVLYFCSERTMRLSRDVYALTGKTGTGTRDAEGSTEVEE
jgi:hypothetical protein